MVLKSNPRTIEELYPRLESSVFIITYGRSGSTLVQNLLNALPGYTIRGENENLVAPLARAWSTLQHSSQRDKMLSTGKTSDPSDPWYGFEAIDPDMLGASLAESYLQTILRPSEETRVIGCKEIRWHSDPALFPVILDFLTRFFPRTRFIFNTRQHDQVAQSGWWKWMNPQVVARQLETAEALFEKYIADHPDRCLKLHYNDYTRGPERWRPLFDFLGEPFDAGLVQDVLGHRLTHLQSG
ncbi:Sulfotransferase family protein [Roseivivax marinus]|uniref:sulfotransferase n=1 Tax=Roseivivax marinus TaxID=1379903 RepID=UPI0008C2C7CB|nr:sulfotransferase [Roseivivax marinus]SEL92042.1 Sulfotransferase family protein [Roseivivax marinus]